MKSLLFAIVMIGVPALSLPAEKWQIYNNDKYKYEIQYPDTYEVIITGPEKERDGRGFRIAVKNITRMHGIDIEIHPKLSLDQIMSKMKAPKLSEIEAGDVITTSKLHKITWQKAMVNGMTAVKMQARFAENDELFLTSLIMDQVVFTAYLLPDVGLDEPFVARIISTFKWETETHNKPDAGDGK